VAADRRAHDGPDWRFGALGLRVVRRHFSLSSGHARIWHGDRGDVPAGSDRDDVLGCPVASRKRGGNGRVYRID
jgi:hypothetical protein